MSRARPYVAAVLLVVGLGLAFHEQIAELPALVLGNNGPVSVVVLEETADESLLLNEQRAMLRGEAFRSMIESTGGKLWRDDADSTPPPEWAELAEAARSLGRYPAMAYRHGDGRIHVVALPPTIRDTLEELGL